MLLRAMLTTSPAPLLSTIFDMAVAKPKTCSLVIFGGSESACGSVMTSTSAGPGWVNAVR